jgi:hypothetical protein
MFPDFLNTLSWWQWTILAAIPPAIVLLYFLKLKRRPVEVPSTYLWRKSIEDLHVNALWQRLRRNLLLLLQLLFIALLAAALLRPNWQGTKLTGHRFIFVVDNSASMTATDVPPTRLDEARRQVGELVDQMRSGDVAMLVSFADAARVEQSFTDNRQQLHRALDAIRPTSRSTSLAEAMKLAAGLANPSRGVEGSAGERTADALPATLYIFTDGRFGAAAGAATVNLDVKFVPIGSTDARNVGVTAFNVRRSDTKPDQLQAFARLENFGRQPAKVPLELFLDSRLIDADRVELAPGERRGVSFDLGAVGSGELKLKADTGDHLAIDDVAYAAINPPRRGRVLLVTAGNRALELALRTKEAAEIAEVDVVSPDFLKTKPYEDRAASGGWQLAIYDRCRPGRMPACNTLFVGSVPPEGGWSAGKKTTAPQIIDIETAHPLMQWLDLGDVQVVEAAPLGVPRGGRTLIQADAGPLLALAGRDAFEDAVLAFSIVDEAADPAGGLAKRYWATNWIIRPSFPAFVLNVLNYLGGGGNPLDSVGLRPGMPVSLESTSALRIRTPRGKTVEVPSRWGRAVLGDTDEVGLYEVLSGGTPSATVKRFAVNLFDPAESAIRLAAAPTIKIGEATVAGESAWEPGRVEIWKYLALAGLAVLLVEWYIYIRRVY